MFVGNFKDLVQNCPEFCHAKLKLQYDSTFLYIFIYEVYSYLPGCEWPLKPTTVVLKWRGFILSALLFAYYEYFLPSQGQTRHSGFA